MALDMALRGGVQRMGDNLEQFRRHDERQQAWLRSRPTCCECGEAIQDDECYEFRGDLMCLECLKWHRRWTEDLSQ